jgi:hypothetical protein
MLLVSFSILFPLCFELGNIYLYVKDSVCNNEPLKDVM